MSNPRKRDRNRRRCFVCLGVKRGTSLIVLDDGNIATSSECGHEMGICLECRPELESGGIVITDEYGTVLYTPREGLSRV